MTHDNVHVHKSRSSALLVKKSAKLKDTHDHIDIETSLPSTHYIMYVIIFAVHTAYTPIFPHAYYILHTTELEWMLSEKGAVKSELDKDPRKKHQIRDVMSAALKKSGYVDPEDSDDSD